MSNPEKPQDFGEHIAGAKKETYFRAIDPKSNEAKSLPLSKLWADKDIKAIKDIEIASIAHTLRDALPTRPRSPYKLNRWLDEVSKSQVIVVGLLEKNDPVFTEIVMRELEKTRNGSKAYLLTKLDREDWKKVGDVRFLQNTNENNSVYLSVQLKGERHSFYPKEPVTLANYNTRAMIDEFASDIQTILKDKEKNMATREMTASSFDIYTRTKDKTAFICAKTDRQKTPLIEFETLAEAREYKKDPENIAELSRRWTAHREHNSISKTDMRNAVNEERTGQSYRDHDITPDEFMATFGVRGGQFGNWVTGDERQQMLNSTYDGFMDLSKALKIDPKAIGLNGTLGIAFGARGSGWASAHYERGEQVINLTKTRGAGSLAHEWWHALDHYMKNGDDLLTRHLNANSTARYQELIAPVRELVKDIHKSELYSRSQKADAYRSQPYFSTDVEMTARAFEGHIQHTLSTMGIKNDFLVNIKAEKDWQKNLDAYPYPKAEELEPLGKAYNTVFDTLKEADKEFVPVHYEPEQIIHADTLAVTGTEIDKTKKDDIFVVPKEIQAQFDKDVERLDATLVSYPEPVKTKIPPVLLALDGKNGLSVQDLPLNLDRFTLHKMQGKVKARQDDSHSLSLDDVKQVLKEIYDPVAVLQDKNGQSLVVITTMKAKNGSTVITPVHLEKTKGSYVFHDLATSFGKENFENWIGKRLDSIVYYNKEKNLEYNTLPHYWLDNKTVGVVPNKALDNIILNPSDIVKRYNEILAKNSEQNAIREKQPTPVAQQQQATAYTPNISQYDTKLNTPYAEKNQAKALGAKWDSANKTWYAPAGLDLNKFEKWLPKEKKQSKQSSDKLANSPAQAPQGRTNAIPQAQRLYLYTRPSDNEKIQELKAQGIVKFDLPNKLWYAHKNNAEAVKEWTTRPNIPTPEQALTNHLRSMGIKVDAGHPIFDERPHRLSNDGSTDKNVMYHAYANQGGVPYARITNFSRNGVSEWTYPTEHLLALRAIEAVERANGGHAPIQSSYTPKTATAPQTTPRTQQAPQKDPEKIALENKMAERAKMLMSFAPVADTKQNYLAKKQVTANNVARIVPDSSSIPEHLQAHIAIGNTPKQYFYLLANNPDNKLVLQRGNLVIPQTNAQGEIRAFETIAYNSKKYALKDAEKKSMMTALGSLEDGKPIIMAEGYATGATLHENTGQSVVVAFGKNGLMDIAKELRSQYPNSKIYIGADNDHNKEVNAGLIDAVAVQQAVQNVYILIPQFEKGDTGKDWNDILVDKGVDELKRQIKEQLAVINPQNVDKAQNQVQTQLRQPAHETMQKHPLDPDVIRQNYPTMSEENINNIQMWRKEIPLRYADEPMRAELALSRLENKLPQYAQGEALPAPKSQAVEQKPPENTMSQPTPQAQQMDNQQGGWKL